MSPAISEAMDLPLFDSWMKREGTRIGSGIVSLFKEGS